MSAFPFSRNVLFSGGYSVLAADLIKQADGVLFANINTGKNPIYGGERQEIDLTGKSLNSLGYFPFERLDRYVSLRRGEVRQAEREAFFEKHALKDEGQQLIVYFGGANSVYEEQAFPAFCDLPLKATEEGLLEKNLFILQPHPRSEGRDSKLFEALNKKGEPTSFFISDWNFEMALACADRACYYQTSAATFFPLIGLPAFQVGHEPFLDVLMRHNLCSFASGVGSLMHALEAVESLDFSSEQAKNALYALMGVDPSWRLNLLNSFLCR